MAIGWLPKKKQEQDPYRTHLLYRSKKTNRNTAKRQNRTKLHTQLLYKSTSLALAPYVELAEVHALPGVIECFRPFLDPPVPHANVLRSSHPISSIIDNNSEYNPFPSFAFARDRPEGFEIFLHAVPQDVAGRPPRLGPCPASRPNIIRLESTLYHQA